MHSEHQTRRKWNKRKHHRAKQFFYFIRTTIHFTLHVIVCIYLTKEVFLFSIKEKKSNIGTFGMLNN